MFCVSCKFALFIQLGFVVLVSSAKVFFKDWCMGVLPRNEYAMVVGVWTFH